MKKIYLFIFILTKSLTLFAQAPNWNWAKGTGSATLVYGNSIAIDHSGSGDIYTTGRFWGSADFDMGAGISNLNSVGVVDIFISKLDNSGNFKWAKSMGGADWDEANSITVDASGNVYSTGFFVGTSDFDPGSGIFNLTASGIADIFISKLDSLGNFVWAKRMGGAGSCGSNCITVDDSGNVYTTGHFTGTADFDPDTGVFNLTAGSEDVFISKLDSSGNFIWAKRFGGASTYGNWGSYINVDAHQNVYTTGYFDGTADFDPDTGIYNLTTVGLEDIFISKLNSSGNFLWAKQIGSTAFDWGYSLTLDAFGNVYSTGMFNYTTDFNPDTGTFNLTSFGGLDIYILKLDSLGRFVWAKSIGGNIGEIGTSISLDHSGNIYTAGAFSGIADFDPSIAVFNLISEGLDDIFISKLDSLGNFVWAKKAGGTRYDYANAMALDNIGNPFIAGAFASSTITFDSTILTNADTSGNTTDLLIAKLGNTLTGIESLKIINDISVFPNPANDFLNIYFQNANKKNIKIIDALGNYILVFNSSHLHENFNIKNFPAGLYLVIVQNDHGEIQKKRFIKAQ